VRIMLVEDEEKVFRFVLRGLVAERFAVDAVQDGVSGLDYATTYTYDLIILDLMLPGLSGTEVLRQIRRRDQTVPVLMLTARDAVADKVENFEAGADDYLTKPFAFAELVARVQALSRRARPALPPVLERDGVVLDLPRHQAARDGRFLLLSPKEFAVLEVLMRAEGAVVSAEELLEKAWDEHADPFTNAVRVAVMTLRRKLGDPPVIETVPGAGYRFGTP